ncbi:MAG TPA: CARDB domain-containing protein, partial [Actinomycetota bacterium]|nr:CARDB domain-containing protein [Actinomycetota bacterium]
MPSFKSLLHVGRRGDTARRGPVQRTFVSLLAVVLMAGLILVPGLSPANANGPTPLTITTTPSSNPVASGDWLTWTITVVNEEPDVLTARLTDQINGMRDLILTSSRGSCTESNLLVTCDGGRLPGHGATWVVTIRGIVTAPDGDTLWNTANAVGRKGGQDFSVESTSSTLINNQPSGPYPDLGVSIDAPLTANPDSPTTYTLTVNNSGAQNANDINVTAHLPGGYAIGTITETSLFDCVVAAPAVECTGGRVNAGSNAIITIAATTAASPGSYMTKAVADPYDAILENDELNNTAEREQNHPSAPPPTEPFVVTKAGSPAGQIAVGEILTYT